MTEPNRKSIPGVIPSASLLTCTSVGGEGAAHIAADLVELIQLALAEWTMAMCLLLLLLLQELLLGGPASSSSGHGMLLHLLGVQGTHG